MAAGNNRAAPYAAFNLHDEPVAGSAGDHELDNRAELNRRINYIWRLQLKVGPRNLHEKKLRYHLCVIYLAKPCCRQVIPFVILAVKFGHSRVGSSSLNGIKINHKPGNVGRAR